MGASDAYSDFHAIDELARKAGRQHLTVLDFGKRSNEEQRGLFELLLRAAFPAG